MNIPNDLRAYILEIDRSIDSYESEIDTLQHEREVMGSEIIRLAKIVRQCEGVIHGYTNAAPLRVQIGGLEGDVRCLDEQIEEQDSRIDQVMSERHFRVFLYLLRNDPNYSPLLEECADSKSVWSEAKELCSDFIKNLDTTIHRVTQAQHVGFVHGQSPISVVDGQEVNQAVGRANTEIGFFNKNFDYDLVLNRGVRLSEVRVPYGGASIYYLQEAKRQIVLRCDLAQRFYSELETKIQDALDPIHAYVVDFIAKSRSLGTPYR